MKDFVKRRALETDEIPAIVEDYRHAAEQAKAAGFDGVEVHVANNYLLEQFIRDSTSQRTGDYGGAIENRLRFPLDVVRAVVEANRVGIRISPATTEPGKTPLDSQVRRTFDAIVDAPSGIGLLYIHDIEGVTQQTRDVPDGVDFQQLRKRFAGAYIANNRYTLDLAEKTLADGKADLFSFGRPFLANPGLVERLRTGAPLADAPKQYCMAVAPSGIRTGPA
jgi:N-ethylmaleimide reductase